MRISNKKRKEQLYKQSPYCHWCGKKTIIYARRSGGSIPYDAATLDHLYSRYDPRRGNLPPHTESIVLSCYKCNNDRAREENKSLPIEKQWELSGRYPLEFTGKIG